MWENAHGTYQQSWLFVLDFVASFREPLWSDWKVFMRSLLMECVDAGLDQHFRAGQSMSEIIVSTAKEHGLEKLNPPPPRITLGWRKVDSKREYFIAYSHSNLFGSAPERQTVVQQENAFAVLRSYLAQLWMETNPEVPLPPVLSEHVDGC